MSAQVGHTPVTLMPCAKILLVHLLVPAIVATPEMAIFALMQTSAQVVHIVVTPMPCAKILLVHLLAHVTVATPEMAIFALM